MAARYYLSEHRAMRLFMLTTVFSSDVKRYVGARAVKGKKTFTFVVLTLRRIVTEQNCQTLLKAKFYPRIKTSVSSADGNETPISSE